MRNIQVVHTPIFAERPTNPARAYLDRNVIEINDYAFYALPPEHQRVILLHEYGHLKHKTRDEAKADSFAIEQSDRKDGDSLAKTFLALEAVGGHDEERMQKAINKALLTAHNRGNKKASKLLGIPVNATGESKYKKTETVILIIIAAISIIAGYYFLKNGK